MEHEEFLLIKLINTAAEIISKVKLSSEEEVEQYYNVTTEKDKETLKFIKAEKTYKVVFLIFEDYDDKYLEKEIYLGKCRLNKCNNLTFKINYKIESELVIKNFRLNLGIDLKNDFEEKSYLSIESSIGLFKQLEFSKKELFKAAKVNQNYEAIQYEDPLDELSQRNEYCKRYIGHNNGAKYIRGEFQRDRERITHAKAFRRLVDKAQIFTSARGDHFRTRMTHTLEVAQIARGISSNLKLNDELSEAIALAHDIGHTPFGHQGERTLDSILKNEIKVINQCDKLKTGGFKHTFQGIRVLNHLEEKYLEFDGLDLSYQVLEGVLKHTRLKVGSCRECQVCRGKCFDIDEFLINGDKEYLFLDYEFSTTLEGQIVSIADEIAQRGHDLDDALASKHTTSGELVNICSIKKMEKIGAILKSIEHIEEGLKAKNRDFVDGEDIKRSRIVSDILAFFINDVTESSKLRIERYKQEKLAYFKEHKRVDEKLIDFSDEGKFILDYLEKFITKKVINSFDVSRFDVKSGKIIEKLFRAYYDNIMILPDTTLKRIYLDIRKVSENVIDFRNGDTDLVKDEITKICKGDLEKLPEEYLIKRKIVVRNIVDNIAGMTDNFALKEYKNLYGDE